MDHIEHISNGILKPWPELWSCQQLLGVGTCKRQVVEAVAQYVTYCELRAKEERLIEVQALQKALAETQKLLEEMKLYLHNEGVTLDELHKSMDIHKKRRW